MRKLKERPICLACGVNRCRLPTRKYCSLRCAIIGGHRFGDRTGPRAAHWKGGRSMNQGYVRVFAPDHPRATPSGYVYEHTLVAERVLGKFLPPNAVVHHVNRNRTDNRPANLVICENHSYHRLLHTRMNRLAKAAA